MIVLAFLANLSQETSSFGVFLSRLASQIALKGEKKNIPAFFSKSGRAGPNCKVDLHNRAGPNCKVDLHNRAGPGRSKVARAGPGPRALMGPYSP